MISTILIILLSELLLRKKKKNDHWQLLLGFTGQPQMRWLFLGWYFSSTSLPWLEIWPSSCYLFSMTISKLPSTTSLEVWPLWISVIPHSPSNVGQYLGQRQENYLWWLCFPTFHWYGSLLSWMYPSGCDVLWQVQCCLQASALYDYNELPTLPGPCRHCLGGWCY